MQVGRNPETVRRWIRSGRLRASKVGTQHVIDERDLKLATAESQMAPLPKEWATLPTGEPMPDIVSFLHESRRSH